MGDIHITGIVNVSGFMEYFVLAKYKVTSWSWKWQRQFLREYIVPAKCISQNILFPIRMDIRNQGKEKIIQINRKPLSKQKKAAFCILFNKV